MAVLKLDELMRLARYGSPGTPGRWRDRVALDSRGDPVNDGNAVNRAAWAIRHTVKVGEDFLAEAQRIAQDRRLSDEGRVDKMRETAKAAAEQMAKLQQMTPKGLREQLAKLREPIAAKLGAAASDPNEKLRQAIHAQILVAAGLPLNDPLKATAEWLHPAAEQGLTGRIATLDYLARELGVGVPVKDLDAHRDALLENLALSDPEARDFLDLKDAVDELSRAEAGVETMLAEALKVESTAPLRSHPGDTAVKFSDGRSTKDGTVIADAPADAAE